MLTVGTGVSVDIEKPAAGGRMIARYDGQILLVAGAIPGERVAVKIERVEKRLAFASTIEVLQASADRRPASDPLCGGCVYSHITYARQVTLKAGIIADAFTRIGRIPLEEPIAVTPSPETGYRLRARLHVRPDAAGFYREGTHELCDARGTNQVSPGAMDAVDRALAALGDDRAGVVSLELSENIAADERAVHFDIVPDARTLESALARAVDSGGLTGCTARGQVGPLVRVGHPAVADPLSTLTRGRIPTGAVRRQPASFFQGNRFLLPDLVVSVLEATPAGHSVLDLYAGAGLFSVALAAAGHERITAVEGDRDSGSDLRENAATYPAVRAVVGRVEDYVERQRERAETIIVDPPRTGISREAMESIARLGAERVVYVSCDPPTMARDARRLLDSGYRLASLNGFDLFPNTPHVETIGVFQR
jgi:tRNA/tmRNA/rRNA uracil-C5-methylase (TrmA/RlmC/RlmD family)